jgi:hypothetical protein
MPDFPIRKIALQIEEILHEGGPAPEHPRRRGAIMAVCANPFAGAYHADLQPAMEDLKPLGLMLTDRLIAALGGALEEGARLVEQGARLLQVDDVDAAALAEDELLHLGVPAPGLMAEMDAVGEQVLHAHRVLAECRQD